MEKAQGKQWEAYDRPTQTEEFQSGGKVLLLLPSANCKILAGWQGPYTIME